MVISTHVGCNVCRAAILLIATFLRLKKLLLSALLCLSLTSHLLLKLYLLKFTLVVFVTVTSQIFEVIDKLSEPHTAFHLVHTSILTSCLYHFIWLTINENDSFRNKDRASLICTIKSSSKFLEKPTIVHLLK